MLNIIFTEKNLIIISLTILIIVFLIVLSRSNVKQESLFNDKILAILSLVGVAILTMILLTPDIAEKLVGNAISGILGLTIGQKLEELRQIKNQYNNQLKKDKDNKNND